MGVSERPTSFSELATSPFSSSGSSSSTVGVSVTSLPSRTTLMLIFLPGLDVGDLELEVVRVLDGLAVELDDDVVLLEARLLGRAVGLDRRDDGALVRLDAELLAHALGDVLHDDAQAAADDLALFPELGDDLLGHVGGDGEADADVPAGRREDVAVDADDLAPHVDQRAAGVAPVDGRVGLDEVLVGRDVDPGRRAGAPWRRRCPRSRCAPCPSGLPMARTHSPTLTWAESPRVDEGRSLASILRRARSVLGSVPTTLAS